MKGGGQNRARTMLTGAMVGLDGIPERFVSGLNQEDEILQLATGIGTRAPWSA